MAEKKLKASPSTSSSRRSTSPRSATAIPNPAARQDRQARQERQEQNNATFARLFATLEGEQRKLKELEARRMKLTEEMRKLRALLLKENERLKIVVAPLANPPVVASTSASAKQDALKKPPATPGVPQPTPSPAPNRTPTPNVPPPTPSPVVAPSPPPVLASNVRALPSILKKTTSTVTAVVETGGPKAVAIGSRPRASSAGTLQRKAKASGRGMLKRRNNKVKNRRSPQNFDLKREELIPLDEDAPAMFSTLETLENRRSYTNIEAPREDLDEVLVSLPALFTFIDAQLEQEPPLFEADTEGQESPEDHYKPDAKSLLEELLGEQEAPPSTVVETQALNLVELAGISIESPEAEGMSIEATLGPEISIATQELVELSFERPASVDLWIEAPESAGISMIAEGLEVTEESKQQASEKVL
ncbi:hypothetical protein KR026_002299 [Drosophila bipectinata]|nr:hypothetical protein KR026_002299 [Drosophila bipectinata]